MISVLITYTGGSTEAIEKTILNSKNLVKIHEIVVIGRIHHDISLLSKLSKKVRVFFVDNDSGSVYKQVNFCKSEWVAIIDQNTVVNTHYFLPFLAEQLNNNVIYYPEHDHPHFRYTEYRGFMIDEDYFFGNGGLPNFDQLMSSKNCVVHKATWLRHTSDSDNMIVVNGSCLSGGMVIKVVKAMICRSISERIIVTANHYRPYREREIPAADQIKQENWSATVRE